MRWYTASEIPQSLKEGLQKLAPHIDESSWAQRLTFGGIFLNGRVPESLDTPLPCPCCIEYYEPRFQISEASSFFPAFRADQIVYQDEDLVAAYKPPGLPSMPARDQAQFSLKQQLDHHLSCTIHMPSRLDMSAQGLLVMSTQERMHKPLQRLFEERKLCKSYCLLTDTAPSWEEQTCVEPIGLDARHPVLRKVRGQNAQDAETHFTVLQRHPDGSALLRAQPKTGRTHQIRVHAAYLGCAIRGDKFYSSKPEAQLHLLSYKLEFIHPIGRHSLSIRLPERFCPAWAPQSHLL